jgi:hypothetical protein
MSAHFGGEAARALLRVTQRAVEWQRATDVLNCGCMARLPGSLPRSPAAAAPLKTHWSARRSEYRGSYAVLTTGPTRGSAPLH